ncbi:hypothetical protein [Actinocrispum wychmicini]|uniref:Uncharacterized protein n=1 Tax=Actinocrispum wychmicini TaxID=1213861 RepID=A0A4R2JFB4_9PSEU|nr:hypothetical protein [Actinocrispum wychmicini]TCO57277.1 hypothetical protein EV192_106754 [Actinocrispum wychmicini]
MSEVNEDVLAGLAEAATDFADETGGGPTLAEFLELVGWSAPTDLPTPLPLKATLNGGRSYQNAEKSRVPELNDHIFEDVRELLGTLTERIGGPVTPQQFADGVLGLIRSGRIPLTDIPGVDVQKLTAEVSGKRVMKPKIGDIVGIPAAAGGYRLGVVLGRNSFGTALGLFHGTSADGSLDPALRGNPRKHPVYTEESLVKDGTWKVFGHDDSLRDLFPADPPIYHKPGAYPGVDTGEFGAAETADGTMRMIDQDEAAETGLRDGTYRQAYAAAYLQKVLDDSASEAGPA